MGRRRGRKWFSRMFGVIASLAALCIARNNVEATEESPKSCSSSTGQESVRDKFLLVVSTLDGRVSALDAGDEGQLVWSVQADSRPLLSSSISKLEVKRDGQRTRLIPSLDGGLYQYDGESIEAVPMTAETLLSSSFRLSDNTMMIGGKDIRTYGIDPVSGKIRYLCTMAGCQDLGQGQGETQSDKLIVITRTTQTVRAVDARLGAEKWNFSVGRHEVEVIDNSKPTREIDDDDDEDGDWVTISPCNNAEEDAPDWLDMESNMKVIVPEGTIVALNPDDTTRIKWQHKFSSPVANAWLMQGGEVRKMSLFDSRHVPAISSFLPTDLEGHVQEPLLYVGLHQNQLYVQPSEQLQEAVSAAASNNQQLQPPRVTWRPYLSTGPSRTPIMNNDKNGNPLQIEQEINADNSEDTSTSLTVWHENYPFDNGYYLFPDFTPSDLPVEGPNSSRGEDEGDSMMDLVLPATLWTWWKEVVAISLITSVVVHVLLTRYARRELAETSRQLSTDSSTGMKNSDSSPDLGDAPKELEYTSRFNQDFECMHCLGKGGFGVVFEAKNKVDDCNYAVKRICIPNRPSQRERVVREAKALAKLDHIGIVRFYQAWLETPPPGWQEDRDKQYDDSECLTPTPCNTGTDLASLSRFSTNQSKEKGIQNLNPVIKKLGILAEEQSSSISRMNHLREGVSQEFSAHADLDYSTEESGSFSYGGGDRERHYAEDENSFSIEFKHSSSGVDNNDNNSCSIPFQSYLDSSSSEVRGDLKNDADSFSIVFEDSGCKDKFSSGDISNDRTSSDIVFKDHSIRIEQSKSDIISDKNENMATKNEKMKGGPKMYLYIQMQLCRRETLKDWMCANTLNRDRTAILDIFDQIVSAVEYVHDCEFMHRDLKPSNIFFSLDGSIKIGDFGLVTAMIETQEVPVGDCGDAFTKHTAEVGTQLYMSPEQISRKQYDHKVDIFSLGMILFELLYPFSTQMERIRTLVDIKRQIFPERFVREMPKEHSVVSWLLSEKPCARPSARDILESELLKDFAPRRMHSRFRNRTVSGSSNNSTGGDVKIPENEVKV